MNVSLLASFLCTALASAVAAQSPAPTPATTPKIPAWPQAMPDVKYPAQVTVKTTDSTQPARLALGARASMQPAKAAPTPELPVSATSLPDDRVLFDDQTGVVRALGSTYKAEFDRSGAAYVPFFANADRNRQLHFAVRNAVVAGTRLPVENTEPARLGERVTFQHGGLRTTYDLMPRGMEQMFWFDALPVRGELQVEVALTTDLAARPNNGGFVFADSLGEVTYSRAVAIDGRGERLPLVTTFENGTLRFVVPAGFVAAAQLPLCIDPLVSSSQLAYQSSSAQPVEVSDIAYAPINDEYQVVFQRYWSATDYDAFVRRFDAQMNPLNLVVIDTSTAESWELCKIASDNDANCFLVVAQTSNGHASPFWIAGRMVAGGTGVTGAPFTIERAGVGGSASGDKLNPDVGGDPSNNAPTWFAVVWERVFSPTDHDVHVKHVDTNGGLLSAFPTYLDNSTAYDSFPSISKTNGGQPYATSCWGVVWQRRYSLVDEDIWGALVRWDSAVTVLPYPIDTSTTNQFAPSISSPTTDVNGVRYYLCAYENQGANSTIVGQIVDQTLSYQGRYDIANQLTPNWPHVYPSVDCDGARFVVGWHEVYTGTGSDFDVRVATCAYAPALGLVIQDSAAPAYTTDLESLCEITSAHVAGSGTGRYGITWTRRIAASNYDKGIYARSYDGVQAGATQSTRTTACGTEAAFTTIGALYLGGQVFAVQNNVVNFRGYVFGAPATLPIGPCPGCILGVNGATVIADPITINVPNDPNLVGATLALQAFQFGSGPCLGAVSVSDTVDLTVR